MNKTSYMKADPHGPGLQMISTDVKFGRPGHRYRLWQMPDRKDSSRMRWTERRELKALGRGKVNPHDQEIDEFINRFYV